MYVFKLTFYLSYSGSTWFTTALHFSNVSNIELIERVGYTDSMGRLKVRDWKCDTVKMQGGKA